jgi:3-hydroxy-9,10-secoandrosta-1,3,5(10)-triene-9,17-dione monooxygenase reductase component
VPLDEAQYRQAIAHFATGVTVITTVADGTAAGMTASAVCSVSLDPVLLLVCINNRLPTHEALEHSRRFAVNVLAEGHEHLARRFATPAPDKFAGVPLKPDSELPVLAEAMAYFLCDVHERFPGGDHSIYIGEVTDCAFVPGRKPLLYFKSAFGKIEDPEAYLLQELAPWEHFRWPEAEEGPG